MTSTSETAIEVTDLWKAFPRYKPGIGSLKALFSFRYGQRPDRVWGLRDLSFTVSRGESVAVIGRNGSGKSTLLGILARVYLPTRGRVCVKGRIAPLLELGAGFHPELTGRENIVLNGAILGLSRKEIDAHMDDIIRFSELEEFIDTPIKTYSVGMQMRLGFAVAVQTKPDVLLVDEVLAVGDEAFQHKCYRQIERFQKEGRTILFVSHDLESVRRVAPRTIWIHRGVVQADGPTEEVVSAYHEQSLRDEEEATE
ncbi:MAG: ABC transporter ATP-binding protein [Armatimonadetes bacterium]|nr:ABC transporter ATP-binding protein [Armatimonadota bacterium]